jgi:DNA-binding transcriptional LysR family regulator
LSALGRQRHIVLTVNQFFTAGQVVAHSNLVTVLPRHFVRVTGFASSLVVRELPLDAPTVHVDVLWHRRMQHEGGHQWLRAAVLQVAGQAFHAG